MSRRVKRPPGRPTLLTRKRETILTALRAGNRLSVAARYANLAVGTVEEWVRRGEGRDPARPAIEPYVTFAREVDQAMAHAEVYAVTQVRSNMGRDARSAIWWLETTHPERWARREPEVPALPPMVQAQNVILIDAEAMKAYAADRIRAERGDSDVADDVRAVRARLVSDSPAG